ncbi:MAG TPA: cysteine hydrolase family protein [Bryobacteraceae bacterium]
MKTVFFDVDTQLDFVYPAGALAVPGAEGIVKQLTELTRFAAANHIQIISTMDAHTEDDPEFKIWKPHCIVGTAGQQKIASTLAPGADPPQIIFEKHQIDLFGDGRLRPLLDGIGGERYVVYGVVTEYCVQSAAFGLLKMGARVEVVTDAIKSLDPARGREILARFRVEGGLTLKCDDVLAGGQQN